MINVVIIEDEAPARKKLKNFLSKTEEPLEIIAEIETVQDSLLFFKNAPEIDIIFSDIELRDGNIFEVYRQRSISCPIIFSTAYDQFWMDAFETNGIDYLLKPYSYARFLKAWNKYSSLKNKLSSADNNLIRKLEELYLNKSDSKPAFKEYIPMKTSSDTYFLKVEDIVYLQSDYGVVFAYDLSLERHLLNQTSLKEIQKLLNPTIFFKINRSEIVNRVFIEKISRYSKNSVAIYLKSQEKILKTSQAKTAAFNTWLGL